MCGIMNNFKCLPNESSVLSAISSDPSMFWFCNECPIEVRNGISNIGELQKCFNNQTLKQDLALIEHNKSRADFEAFNDKVVDMNCRIDELNSLKSHMDNQIGEVEQRMKNTWADEVKGEVKKSVEVLAEEVKISNSELNKTVDKIKGDVDSINRDCNIVVFRMKES